MRLNLVDGFNCFYKLYKILYIFILWFILFFNCTRTTLPLVKAEIGNKEYSFEVAATSKDRQKGLMFRKRLAKNSGMLFVYGRKIYLSFYMKNTLIPLDIAFIDDQFQIIDIQQMEPLDETSITSNGEAQYALEVNRDFFKRVGLKVGDKIKFISPIPYISE